MLQYLAMYFEKAVWENFGSWLRTIRKATFPSEMVTINAMKNGFLHFLNESNTNKKLTKFIFDRIDTDRLEKQKLLDK